MNLEETINKIISTPLFLKLKNIIENNPHREDKDEDTYSHLIKTLEIAKQQIDTPFITDSIAKTSFKNFINEEIYGIKRRDIMILISLLHDTGKILSTEENGLKKPILVTNSEGRTFCPNHEYWGSTIVDKFLDEFNLPAEVITYISCVIKLHDTFNDYYWESKKTWQWDLTLNDVKSRAEGYYKEALFNIYCDTFTASVSSYSREMIVKTFNDPKLYAERKYVIA